MCVCVSNMCELFYSKFQYKLDTQLAGRTTSQGLNLLRKMLEYDPTKRIKAEEALNHEYFKELPLPTIK